MSDPYQARYLAHLKRKAAMIATESVPTEASLMEERRSIRVFQDRPVPRALLEGILEAVRVAPQSCNRQALTLSVVPGHEVGEWLLGG
ncbi:MAG TPA: nitroreductase family protein, partial [Anaerolineae bacterium]|nr:nitroreductase family protein [Anaerolineae bacterium]